MKTAQVQLNKSEPQSDRLVKRGARFAFKALRAMTEQAKQAPGFVSQSLTDIRQAWDESRPNV
jgi:hypothetical protein